MLALGSCYALRASDGGGQTRRTSERVIDPADVALPEGYRIEAVARGLNFPSGVAFDAAGTPCVVEAGYCYGEVWSIPRLVRINADRTVTEIARGDNPPWNGVAFHDGHFYIAEGGHKEGGRILKISQEGTVQVLVDQLPSLGDHHTNGPAIGPDGMVYFGQGTATNAGVVGEDNYQFGWLARHPDFHDVPAFDITLTGENFTGPDLFATGTPNTATGAFHPYGSPSQSGEVVRGQVPCTGAVMRVPAAGGAVEVVAWGLRNPFGLAFAPDGRLFVTDNSYDVRGSRPIWGTGDLLWAIDTTQPPLWFGWPDFHGQRPLTDSDHFAPRGLGGRPKFLLASHPNTPPRPAAVLDVHASADGIDFSTSDAFGYRGDAFVAMFGDMAPPVGKVLDPAGFKVVRVDVETGVIEEFAVQKAGQGPSSKLRSGGLERPVAVRFTRDGTALYIVDFGILTSTGQGHTPHQNTGVLWRVTRGGRS